MKSLLWVLALLLSLALLPTRALADLPAPKSTPENANMAAGRKAIDAKDFKAAVGYLTKAVQEDPNNADAQRCSGTATASSEPLTNPWILPEGAKDRC